jgi:hypothetical protein
MENSRFINEGMECHRMKGKRNKYETKTDVFKQECITVVVRDFIT